MEYTRLGTTDIVTPRLYIGGMSFRKVFPDFHQWVIGRKTTQTMITRVLELDVNFIDAANVYSHGTSEEFTGILLKNLGVKREGMVLASKVYFNEGYLSHGAIEREINGTLKYLGVDYLGLYVIHRFGYAILVEETLGALDTLVRSGKVRALGASSMYTYQLYTMQVAVDARGWTRLSFMQNHYSLFYREDEWKMTPVCYQHSTPLTPYSPLAFGRLIRPTQDSDSVCSTSDVIMRGKYDRGRETDIPIIERVAKLAQRRQVVMANVALAWLWTKGVAAPIVDCSRLNRINDIVWALELTPVREKITFLEEPYVPHKLVDPLVHPEDVSQR